MSQNPKRERICDMIRKLLESSNAGGREREREIAHTKSSQIVLITKECLS